MTSEQRKSVEETRVSLARIHDFDAKSIGRKIELGDALNFEDGIPPLEKALLLFREVSPEVLADMSQQRRDTVKQSSDGLFNVLEQIRNFTPTSANPKQARDGLIQQLIAGYDNYFEQLWPSIAYSVRRNTDFARLEHEARAAIQSIEDRTKAIEASLRERQGEAEEALDAIRKVAAEQGVSQQALYFKEESEAHAQEAKVWYRRTRSLTIGLGIFAASTLFLHKIHWLAPASSAEAIQFGIGKMLTFATIAYFLILASRNYMAHRHNAIVNKHRQNSLVTYKALVEAAGDAANRDIILAKAADSVFGQQSTGFTKHDSDEGKALSMVNVGAGALKGSSGS